MASWLSRSALLFCFLKTRIVREWLGKEEFPMTNLRGNTTKNGNLNKKFNFKQGGGMKFKSVQAKNVGFKKFKI